MALQIEKSKITKLTITGADRLDPVSVFLEDFEPGVSHNNETIPSGVGKITIECYGKSWSAYFGGMGTEKGPDGKPARPSTIAEFFTQMDQNYLAKRLSDISSSLIDNDSIQEGVFREIIKMRLEGDFTKEKARSLFEQAKMADYEDPYRENDLLVEVLGDDWWCRLPSRPNPDY
ncbi:MAG TPA: hypothetical protein VIY47_14840, partial [Ignavibacteriaceae bacterium]